MFLIKAVLFDLDGTLINTNNLIIESFKYTLEKHLNLRLMDKDIVKFFGEPLDTTLARFDKENVELLVDTYRTFNKKNHDNLAKGFEDALIALKKLKEKGIKIAVVTSKRRQMAERGLKLFKLYDLIDVVITPEDTLKHKPEGEPAMKACELLKVNPKEALMVGDSHYDILCGKNAGCKTCVVEYTALSLEEILGYGPDYRINTLMDILSVLDKSKEIA